MSWGGFGGGGGGGRANAFFGMCVTHIFCVVAEHFFNPQITSLIAVSRRPRGEGNRQNETTIKLMNNLAPRRFHGI